MKRTGTHLKGYRIGKGGRVEKDPKRLSVSDQLKQRPGGSKKVRVARRNPTLEDVLVAEEREFARRKTGRGA